MTDSPTTELRLRLLAGGYDPIPAQGKRALLPNWQAMPIDPAAIRSWAGMAGMPNTGIRCGHVVGVDIDILDAALSERVKNLALRALGDTSLIRIGQAPKQLMLYRTATPGRKKQRLGTLGKVEVLGVGQQFVGHGTHPDTLQPYVWPERSPLEVPLHELPEVTEETLEAFLGALEGMIGVVPRAAPAALPAPVRANGAAHPTDDATADVLEALQACSPDCGYHEWVKVGFALYAALGPSAGHHYEAWSSRGATYKPGEPLRKWPSFAKNDHIHRESLFWLAQQHGWAPAVQRGPDVANMRLFKAQPLPRHDPVTGEIIEDSPGAAAVLAFTPYAWIEPANIPPRQFLYGGHYIRQFLSMDVAPGGLGKSSLVIAEAVAMAAHRDLLDTLPTERLRVAYWNGEDPMEELQRRVQAVALHYGVWPAEIEGRLFVDTGRLLPLVLAYQDRKGGPVLDQAVIDAIVSSIMAGGIDVLIIDPFVASHRVAENDNPAMELVAKAWSHIADVTNCAVNLVHHSRKLNGEEVTAESGRGGSALHAACRSVRTLNQMTKEEAEKVSIQNRRLFFRVDNGKPNLKPPAEKAEWHQMVNVDFPNGPMGTIGDKIGVVTRWEMVNPVDSLTVHDLKAVQNAVSAGKWRANVQAKDWVGKAVARALKYALPDDKGKVKSLIVTWLGTGALTVVTGLDSHREPRDYIEVGNWVEPDA